MTSYDHFTGVLDRFTRSQNKWHITALLLADMLKDSLPAEYHAEIDGILAASKDDVAHMLLDYRQYKPLPATGSPADAEGMPLFAAAAGEEFNRRQT